MRISHSFFYLFISIFFIGCNNQPNIDTSTNPKVGYSSNNNIHYFKNTKNIDIKKLSFRTNETYGRKIELLQNNNSIFLFHYQAKKRDKDGIYVPIEIYNLTNNTKQIYKKRDIKFNKFYRELKKLKYKRVDEISFLAISDLHKAILHINSQAFITKQLNLIDDKSFKTFTNKPYFLEIEYIMYKKSIAKILKTLKNKNYEDIYNIKDDHIKYFIKKPLVNSFFKIEQKEQLSKYKTLLDNFNIKNSQNYVEVQKNNIDIINVFKSIDSKEKKEAFLAKKNKIYKVAKKVGIKDKPSYENSKTLSYYERGQFIIALKIKENWIQTDKGWINGLKLESQYSVLNQYKRKAESLEF